MAVFESRAETDILLDLLERERRALRSCRFDLLERLIPEKERLAKRMRAEPPTQPVLEDLRRRMVENDRLLGAMRAGLRRAKDRVERATRPAPLTTYDKTGRRQRPVDGIGREIHRA